MRKPLAVIAALLCSFPTPGRAAAGGSLEIDVRARHVIGRTVTLTAFNGSTAAVRLTQPWTIVDRRSGQPMSEYFFTEEELELAPGEEVVWGWNQDTACYGACANVREGDPVGAGRYGVALRAGNKTIEKTFQVGRYFTLGFRSRPQAKFAVYVSTPDEVAQMEAEAAAEEKTLIVSGLVRGSRPYNSDWRFTMGPGSIVLGEVFIEVCDGSPYYVQRNLKEWRGERWCPWSSYVAKVGR